MILVVNLNPSLDKIYEIKQLQYGKAMRVEQMQNTAGGKGSHVASVINSLGEDCTVVGFLGGFIGAFIGDALKEKGIINEMTQIEAPTRSCLNVATGDGQQTEFLEPGPWVTQEEQARFLLTYKRLLAEADMVVASGSLPQNLSVSFYRDLIELANAAGKRFLLDTSGAPFVEGIKAKPFFVKPNKDEIEAFSGKKIDSIESAIVQLHELQALGIKMPGISLGAEGSVVGTADAVYHALPPKMEVINAVGSGDAYVAGLAVGLKRNLTDAESIRLAAACGTANVCERESGFIREEQVELLKNRIMIRSL